MDPLPLTRITMKLSTVSSVTKSCLKDFLLMKKTLEQYHYVEFYLAVDDYCYDYLHDNFEGVKCFKLIDVEDADHVDPSKKQEQDFIDIIQAKFDVAKKALKESNFIFWCDVDHIFLNPFEESILDLVNRKQIDAALTPHYSDGFADEKTVGYYNCGFALISNFDFLETWEDLFKQHKELGLYYEQKPLELTTQLYHVITLPLNYNVGWWKFLGPNAQIRWDSIKLNNDKLTMMGRPLVNFHFHFFKENNNHAFDHNAFKKAVKDILSTRRQKGDDLVIYEINRLEGKH